MAIFFASNVDFRDAVDSSLRHGPIAGRHIFIEF
jgi:hypothetical protein